MDRRDALKKLGMGGAAVVGASMVVSAPAFAVSTPTIVSGLVVEKTGTLPEFALTRMRFRVNPGTATCSGSPLGAPVASTTVQMSNPNPISLTANPDAFAGFTTAATGNTFIYAQNTAGFADGQGFNVAVSTTWTCDDGSGPQTSTPQLVNATALWSGGTWSFI